MSLRDSLRAVDERSGAARLLSGALRYVFPEHWTFLLGEIALYCFVVLVVTGVYLTLFFEPSTAKTVYEGTYAPLRGTQVSRAYASTVDLSFAHRGGLLMRQTHHWAALVFVAAIVLHLMRVVFTGAFRKPREPIYYIGLGLLMAAVLEGFAGYSLPDDLLSGMGLAIAYSVSMAIPIVGAQLSFLLWGGEFPGTGVIESRLYLAHVLLLPALIAALIGLHLVLVVALRHTQFPGPGREERNVVGTPLWPAYALRSLALFLAVASVLVLLGGLVQVNPVWQWGPYEPWLGTNGAQPDWYLGWLIGALRLMPSFDVHLLGYDVIPNPFFGGVLFPLVVFGLLFSWPTLERRLSGDRGTHHLLDRPRDAPYRTAAGAAFFAWVATIFVAGSADRIFEAFGVGYSLQVWVFRILALALPILAFVATRAICRQLARDALHPLRGWTGVTVERTADGGYVRSGDRDESD